MPLVLIFDCGATNLRTIAIDPKGNIIAFYSLPNNTHQGKESPNYHIWDFEEIWQKLSFCVEKTLEKLIALSIPLNDVVGISVTTFGVDGAPFDKYGKQLYPIISWKCPRTLPIMDNLDRYLDVEKLYLRNGVGKYSFNTLLKLIWLKEYQPKVFNSMDKFVFISSMLNQRLTGKFTTDRSMAGTSMMTNLRTNNWDQEILEMLELTEKNFPPMKNEGEIIGNLSANLCKCFGLNPIPIISCGHDTQFAVFGSGAELNQPVLSSGTWEILMARTQFAQLDFEFASQGGTTEFDVKPNCFNPAVQWVGSGILEWLGKLLFADVANTEHYYSTMISEGEQAQKIVKFEGVFSQLGQGNISELSMFSSRGEIYRGALQYMADQLKRALNALERVGQFKAKSIICVGGGSKNLLWNQLRANTLGLPIDVVDIAESTVLGAAMFTFSGIGIYDNPEQAQKMMKAKYHRIYPQLM